MMGGSPIPPAERPMPVALVTGASRGIGRAIALRLAEDGHDVGVGCRAELDAAERLAEELRRLGRRAVVAPGDLANPAAPDEVCDRVEAELGPVDVLVANAGVASGPRPLAEISNEEWDRFHAVNLRAPFLLVRRLLPGMLERGHGRIVLLSSIAAYTGGLMGAHYASSKAGLHGLAHSLAAEAAGRGVTVNVVAPALIETDMVPGDPAVREGLAGTRPVGRLGRPEEVADLVAAVVRNGYLSNQSIVLDGGAHPT
jgi:3-oxoacyl-[acyl-carrier protein] reductase